MTYKVLLVDDEAIIVEGLRTSIEWEKLGCSVIGTAGNGIEAIEAIDSLHPDIILTDIKMPGKGGIEVTEHALSVNPRTRVILLSGYNDFEYARRAVKLGAFDYLLKPTVYGEVMHAIGRASRQLDDNERREREIDKFRNEFLSHMPLYRQAFLGRLLSFPHTGELFGAVLEDAFRLYEIAEGPYYLVVFKTDDSAGYPISEADRQLVRLAMEDQIAGFVEEAANVYVVPIKDDYFAILWVVQGPADKQEIHLKCERLQKKLQEDYLKLSVSMGISRTKVSPQDLNNAYLEAYEALQHYLYLGSSSIIFYEDLPRQEGGRPEPVSYDMYVEIYRAMLNLILIGDETASRQKLQQLFGLFEYHRLNLETVKIVCIEFLSQLMAALPSAQAAWADRNYLYSPVLNGSTVEGVRQWLEQIAGELSRNVYHSTRSTHKKMIQQVLELIRTHCCENITLSWISERVYLNSSYLSRLIRNECGETFSDLLTRYQIDKAKELLRNPVHKIYEVSEMLGFADPQYFAVKFKKYTEMTPTEFRDQLNDLF